MVIMRQELEFLAPDSRAKYSQPTTDFLPHHNSLYDSILQYSDFISS